MTEWYSYSLVNQMHVLADFRAPIVVDSHILDGHSFQRTINFPIPANSLLSGQWWHHRGTWGHLLPPKSFLPLQFAPKIMTNVLKLDQI